MTHEWNDDDRRASIVRTHRDACTDYDSMIES